MKNKNEFSLSEAIGLYLKSNKILSEKIQGTQIEQIWLELVGATAAQQTRKIWLDKGTLYVQIGHPTWKTELSYLKEDIRKKINAILGEEICCEVRIF